ncbi:reverse transcriptase domain-containing protein [Tanacetum coccineum]
MWDRREIVIVSLVVKWLETCHEQYNIDNLTIEQYLILTQERQTRGMVRTEFVRMITKDIEDMTIAEYMESTNLGESKILENKHQPDKLKTNDYFPSIPPCFKPDIHEPLEKNPNDCQLSTPNSYHEIEEVSSDEDVDEWLNAEISKRMIGQDKEEEEDALIDILKTVVEESEEEEGESSKTLPCKQQSNEINPGGFTLPCTISNLKIYAMADVGAGINMMPKSLFEHLKLTNLKKTSMVVEMADMTKKAPLGIVENILVKIDKFLFRSDFVVIDTLEGPNETMLLGEYFNPNEVENDDSPALEQRTLHYSEESIDTVDSSDDSQEDEVGSHLSEDVVSRWHVCKPVHVTFKVCEEDCGIWPTCNPDLSFCSGNDAIYGKEKMGCSSDGTRDNPYSRNFEVYKEEFDDEIKQLENECKLKARRKIYALEEVWEKCEKFYDSTKLWYDKGFELWQNGIEEIDYTPLLVKSVTFEVHRYTFKNKKSFISITKQMEDILTLGRVNGSRFIEKTRREMDEEGGATRKT